MTREPSIALFRNLENPDTHAALIRPCAKDVDWTVGGTPSARRRYLNKPRRFSTRRSVVSPARVLSDRVHLDVENLFR